MMGMALMDSGCQFCGLDMACQCRVSPEHGIDGLVIHDGATIDSWARGDLHRVKKQRQQQQQQQQQQQH